MPFATCPQCDERIRLADMPDIGDIVTCNWCDARLEVVSLGPIVLDWPFELDEDDETDDDAEFAIFPDEEEEEDEDLEDVAFDDDY